MVRITCMIYGRKEVMYYPYTESEALAMHRRIHGGADTEDVYVLGCTSITNDEYMADIAALRVERGWHV